MNKSMIDTLRNLRLGIAKATVNPRIDISAMLLKTGLVDPVWYSRHYPETNKAQSARHFCQEGYKNACYPSAAWKDFFQEINIFSVPGIGNYTFAQFVDSAFALACYPPAAGLGHWRYGKILLAVGDQTSLKYVSSLLYHLPPFMVDVMLMHPNAELHRHFKKELGNYTLMTSWPDPEQYEFLMTDAFWIFHSYEHFSTYAPQLKKILYQHSLLGSFSPDLEGGLFLFSCEQQCYHKDINLKLKNLSENSKKSILELPAQKRSELAFSGPFHLGDFPGIAEDKQAQKQKLAQLLGCGIPTDRPLLLCVQERVFEFRHLARLMNRLADSCCVIFRSYGNFAKKDPLHLLNKNIIVMNYSEFDINEARYAADFILAGVESGTCLSSLMLGLPLIAYYTRPCHSRYHQQRFVYSIDNRYVCNEQGDDEPMRKFLKIWPHKFDLLDVERIRKAIFEKEYLDWYYRELPFYRKEIFGDYSLNGSALLAAEQVIKYVAQGSLGNDCAAVYLRPNG